MHLQDNYRTREQFLEKIYELLKKRRSIDSVHIPHSDVFYVREALENANPGIFFELNDVEDCMKETGWNK